MKNKELKKQIEEAEKEVGASRSRLDKLKEQDRKQNVIPILRKMIGLCYKTRNSYGGDSKGWWLYAKVLGVAKDGDVIAERFQKIDCERVEFEYRHEFSYSRTPFDDWQKVPLSEYESAKKKAINFVQKQGNIK